MTPERLFEALAPRLRARPLLLLLDVDGTLAPIATRPEAAAVPPETRESLARISRAPGVYVALVSGRGSADARTVAGLDHVLAIGNHGIETLHADGTLTIDPVAAPYRTVMDGARMALDGLVQPFAGVRVENKVWTLSVHYREAAGDVEPALRDVMERIAVEHGLELTRGKKVFELRPPIAVNKGSAAVALAREVLGEGPQGAGSPGAVLYAGDDRTDEDAFTALRAHRADAITIRVERKSEEAPTETAAEFELADVASMGAFLGLLAAEVTASR